MQATEVIEGFRLSPQQEHLWLLQQADKSSAYRAFCAVAIEGNLNIETLTAALEDVVNRHEILRTNFTCLPGMTIPVQVINDGGVLLEHEHNLSNLNAEEQSAWIAGIFQEISQRTFEFEQKLLLHTSLVTLAPDRYLLFVSLPALCADTATLKNFVRELNRSYTACLQEDEVSDDSLQYADFAEWQNELLESEEAEIGKEYWRQQDISAFLDLHLGDNQGEFKPEFITSTITPRVVAKLEVLAEKYDTSVSTVLLSCWQALLWRMTGQPDIAIGTAFDGRKYEELQGALGLFAKYLPLHCHFDDNLRFRQLITQVTESVKHIHKWQECFTWDQITDALPFFPICFDFEEFPGCRGGVSPPSPPSPPLETRDFGVGAGLADNFCNSQITPVQNPPLQGTRRDVSFSIYQQYACIDRFKIKLSCLHRAGSLITDFHYDGNLLCPEEIHRWADLFHKIVESAANNPEARIAELEILSDRARHQLLVEFNQTQVDYPRSKCIHHLIEEQAERTPDNIAVTFENQQLTYRELNTRANQLAHYLQKLGVGAEVLVGICVERSPEMIIGILGILKAGAAYLPLDPSYPQERLAFMLSDAQVSVLLTTEDLTSRLNLAHQRSEARQRVRREGAKFLSVFAPLRDQDSKSIVCLDTDWKTIALESNENPNSNTTPENLVYVIYTSGSTGKPKGVEITHRNLVHSTTARITYYQEPVTSFLLLSSFAFDSSVAGIFWTLCQGGTLYLPEEGLQREVPKLIELIAQNHVSHLLSLPSLYALILEQAKPEQIGVLRAVIVAGEACPRELVERHLQLSSDTLLFNEYGPTEGTVWSSVYNCCSGEVPTQIPIGRPIANTQIYLLDSYLQPVPIGVCGEVYISGDGLARGYLNQPSMTAAKFIPNLFSDRPGMRLYKTGDLARYLPDGNIEFKGRIDEQVKIRGFRIELGEIEAVLSQHQGVRDAAVIVREDVPGDKRLVAYIVPQRESPPSMGELRLFIKEKLPDYMVPSAFVLLKQLPLSPNGKVNRRALPAPEQVRPEFAGIFVAPRTPLEAVLTGIWAEVLGIQQVGVHDNFFDLGGHSLLTTQLLAKVREAIHVDVSLRSLLELPTVAGLAERIEKIRQSEPTGTNVLDLNESAILDPAIRADGSLGQPATEPKIIFLTGATGFLGAFLLYELLQQSQADIYCLVRSPDAGSGKKRLQSSLDSYSLWDESFSDRIVPVVGSLSEPLLGLGFEQFQVLASQVDVIYHNGAWVNFIYPYETLKAANVLGTEEVLRLASQVKLKPVHFISTTSVFPSADPSGKRVIDEQESPSSPELLDGGYSQSKWVAEKLVTIAQERGIPVSIYRPGRISGHSQTGACNANDFLYRAIAGCIQLGSAPEGDIKLNIAPVDYVACAIAYLSRQASSRGKSFHLVNPQVLHLSELVSWIRSLGYPLEQVAYDNWREQLLAIAATSPDHPIYPLVPLFPARVSQPQTPNAAASQFNCHNTLAGLAGTSIICPPIDSKLLRTYFSYLLQSGFLDAPPQQ